MSCHLGYSGGLKRSYSSNCTMPYYATPSEEILFHVSTRMPSSGTDIEQKVYIVLFIGIYKRTHCVCCIWLHLALCCFVVRLLQSRVINGRLNYWTNNSNL